MIQLDLTFASFSKGNQELTFSNRHGCLQKLNTFFFSLQVCSYNFYNIASLPILLLFYDKFACTTFTIRQLCIYNFQHDQFANSN